MLRKNDGFALLAVLLVMALLGVIGAEFAFSMRLEASMVRSYKEGVIAMHLAEAGVEQALREILADSRLVAIKENDPLMFYRAPDDPLPRLPRKDVELGDGRFSYRIMDEAARLNVNTASSELLERLLTGVGQEKRARDTILASLQDWKDPNEEHRLNGAESDDTYLKRAVPYRSRNANLDDISELLQINGVTPELYHGGDDGPGLVELLTVHGRGQVNINTASEPVLRALGLSDAEVSDIVQSRKLSPYAVVPPRFAGRGLGTTSITFRIEADGILANEARARVTAIVERRTSQSGQGPEVVVLMWKPGVPDRKAKGTP